MNEFQLIERFVAAFDVRPSPDGPGDDCAVLRRRGLQCVTTDALFEGVHFTLDTFSFEDVGHKALAVNLSDLAAMGAAPDWFTVALGLPTTVGARDVEGLARGMSRLARVHGARLVGGNVSRAGELSLTITAAGTLPRAPLVRSGARAGELVFVTGALGDAAGGLEALTAGARSGRLVQAQRRPSPHLAFSSRWRALMTAAIDVSDGLLQDLGHLCRASGLGAELSTDALPLSRALLAAVGRARAIELALRGGEDYVLLFAAPERHRARLASAGAFEIGRLIDGAGVRVDGKAISTSGFRHR